MQCLLLEFLLCFSLHGNIHRKRLFGDNLSLNHYDYRCLLSCIHIRVLSHTSFGKCIESHASFNLATPLGWTGKCIKQRCHTILRKMQIGKLLVIWCCCTIPPPPKHPSTPVLVVELHAVLGTGRAVYMQAWSREDSAETDACQR